MQQVDADTEIIELHATVCRPKLLEQFTEKLNSFNQTDRNLLMSHVDKIVRWQLGVRDRDFTMEDFLRSERQLNWSNKVNQ